MASNVVDTEVAVVDGGLSADEACVLILDIYAKFEVPAIRLNRRRD